MNFAKYCKQTAVYWAPSTPDAYGGTVYASPVELAVRWEDGQYQVFTEEGEEVTVNNHVICLQDLELGGLLWKGAIADWTGGTPTPATDDVYRVRKTGITPDIRAQSFLREAWM